MHLYPFLLILLLHEIDGRPPQEHKAEGSADTGRVSRERKPFKYVPLNSMTLAARKPPQASTESSNEESSEEQKSNDALSTKRPWWQSLPSNKVNKNKVILEEYDKVKASMPEWPWLSALKGAGSNNPLTRSKVTNRVVMTTTEMMQDTSSTTTPSMIDTENEETKVMTTMKTNEDTTMVSSTERTVPTWLKDLNNAGAATTKTPNWFASWSKVGSSSTVSNLKTSSTDKPFNYKINQGLKTSFPVIEVNGPSIKLPSFPIMSDQLTMYSSDLAESRTESEEDEFNLNFFPQRPEDMESNNEFTLLVNEPKLGDLETTTTQRPLITQSLSPMENREALSQLVSLYERAPTIHNIKGEEDKTKQKLMEKDKLMDDDEMTPMRMKDNDHKYKIKLVENEEDDMQMEESNVQMTKSAGIPPSITLQLAAASKVPAPLNSSAVTSSTTSSTTERTSSSMHHQKQDASLHHHKMEMKSGGLDDSLSTQDRRNEVKETLQKLVEANHEMMRSVQRQLSQQTNLLRNLMELL